jgi:mannose-1-phosphate guanylyltransferase
MSLLAHIVSRDAKGLADDYAQLDVNSFDYAVLERAPEVLAVEAQFPWSDLGNWDAIARVLPALHGGHAVAERVLARDAKKNVVYAPGKSVLLLGVEGIVVAADGDDLLVMSRDRAQELKELVQRLRDP